MKATGAGLNVIQNNYSAAQGSKFRRRALLSPRFMMTVAWREMQRTGETYQVCQDGSPAGAYPGKTTNSFKDEQHEKVTFSRCEACNLSCSSVNREAILRDDKPRSIRVASFGEGCIRKGAKSGLPVSLKKHFMRKADRSDDRLPGQLREKHIWESSNNESQFLPQRGYSSRGIYDQMCISGSNAIIPLVLRTICRDMEGDYRWKH